jgi:hypothetical protein
MPTQSFQDLTASSGVSTPRRDITSEMSVMEVTAHVDPAAASAQSLRKRILFVGLPYYSYTDSIVASLEEKGFTVEYYPTETRTFWSKTIRRFLPRTYGLMLRKYHASIVSKARNSRYDYVFFLQIHTLAKEHVERMRSSQPTAKFILYNWDSLSTHDYRPYLRYLDSIFTFDRDDAAMLGAHYLPLFALPGYFEASHSDTTLNDIYFVGSIGTLDRFAAVRRFADYCRAEGLRFAKHLHCSPAIFLMLLRKGLYAQGMTLRALSTDAIVRLMNQSAAVFDFPNRPQSGYTMRLIENMCAGKKIVTSNAAVRGEKFYSKDQFFVVENLNFSGLKAFLETETEVSTTEVPRSARYSEFTLDRWLDSIFSE